MSRGIVNWKMLGWAMFYAALLWASIMVPIYVWTK